MSPTLLALETSSDACSVALRHDGVVHADHRVAPRMHARTLLPMVDGLLAGAGIDAGALDALVFGRGPGSFTGLRIAAAVTQGLAWARDLPVVAVSSLEILALTALAPRSDARGAEPVAGAALDPAVDRVLTVVDARMSEVYWNVFRRTGDGVEALGEDRLSAPESVVVDASAAGASGTWAIVGDGAALVPVAARPAGAALHADVLPDARAALALGALRFAAGEAGDARSAVPVYLRDERRWRRLDDAPAPAIPARS